MWITLALGALLLLLLPLLFLLVRWIFVRRRYDHIRGSKNGLLGSLPGAIRNFDRLYDYDMEMFAKFGSTHKVTLPFWRSEGMVRTIDARNVKHILKTNWRNYVKPHKLRRVMSEIIGDGIFRINHGYKGEYEMWHKQRKTMSKIFFKDNFSGFLQEVFVRHSRTMCDVLGQHANARIPVDIQSTVFAFTLDSIAEIGFGENFNSLRDFQAIGNSFDDAQEIMFRRMLRPFFDSIIGKLIYPEERTMVKRIAELDAFSVNLIRKRRNAMKAANDGLDSGTENAKGVRKPSKRSASVGQDILSLFMDPRFTTTHYTDKQLQNIIMSVMLAGRDTTAATLAYSIAELMMHPDILKKLRAEFAQHLPHTDCCDGTAPVTMEDVTQRNMPYLHGFIYEMLRLHPPVPFESKFCVEEDVWPDGTVIPANTSVSFNIHAMGRDAEFWPNPLEIRPERWNGQTPSAFEFPVFQAGPRICLGMNMAVLEAKIALIYLVSNFDFFPADGCQLPPKYKTRLTQSIRGGLPVRVERIKGSL